MSLRSARERLRVAKVKKSTDLYLDNEGLSNNDLGKLIPEIKELSNLTTFFLSENKLINVDFLKELPNLNKLYLNGNKLINVNFLKELPNLFFLDLRGNPNLPNFGINIDNKILDKFDINKIIKFYEDLAEQGKDYIYEAKVLIIGQPRAGKTTLRRKLINPTYQPREATDEEKKSTVGVEIERFSFQIKTLTGKKREFVSYLWDFGGQDIQYVLHQYFLTERSLYVFLYNVGTEDEKTNYWFEIIASLGKDCPVLVVLNYNQIEKSRPSNFSIDTYRKEFADKIKDISERKIDFAVNDGDWDDLYRTIRRKVSTLEHIGRDFLPQKTVDVRYLLSAIDKPTIGIDDYYDICKNHQIEKEEANTILTRLHEFGVALWYQNDDKLRHQVILKPNWVIDALYVVLIEDSIQKNNGRFFSQDVFKLWKNYDEKDKVFLLSLMEKGVFSTAYKLRQTENEYIVPALLTENETEYTFNEQNLIQIYYQYGFLPEGVISRLIVELNEKIHSQNNEQIVWKKGVLLKSTNSFAEVIQNTRDRRINIRVSGANSRENRELLSDIRKEIDKIHRLSFKNRLTVNEYVPCPCNICQKKRIKFESLSAEELRNLTDEQRKEFKTDSFTLTNLVNRLNNPNKKTIECHKSGEDIDVPELLGEIYFKPEDKRELEMWTNTDYLPQLQSKPVPPFEQKRTEIKDLEREINKTSRKIEKCDEEAGKLSRAYAFVDFVVFAVLIIIWIIIVVTYDWNWLEAKTYAIPLGILILNYGVCWWKLGDYNPFDFPKELYEINRKRLYDKFGINLADYGFKQQKLLDLKYEVERLEK